MIAAGERHADILVIGSGPGGAVCAAELAGAGRQVLMVEEGRHVDLAAVPHFSREELLVKYRNAGVSVAMGRHKLAWVEGRCVGGGSEINRGLYHRTPDYILDDWRRRFGVDDLDLGGLTPHFEACEEVARVEYVNGAPSEMSLLLHRGAMENGWHAIETPRLFRYHGNGGTGDRQTMSATFVNRFLAAGGALSPATRIDRLTRSNGNWHAEGSCEDAEGRRRPISLRAPKVVVACGAVQTPALLRRSGVTRNVGNSLRFHPMVKAVAEFDHVVNRPGDCDPVHQIKEFEPRFGMGCSISSPSMLGMALAGRDDAWNLVAERWRHMGIYYVQSGVGTATVRNLPGFSAPFVRIHFSREDLRVLAEGLARLAQALFAAGALRVHPCVAGYPTLHSPADIARLPELLKAADGTLTSVHVFSSCPMGEDRSRAAADSFGKVHGTDGLYIGDASLLCTPTMVNPQGTVMAVARRNARAMMARGFQ